MGYLEDLRDEVLERALSKKNPETSKSAKEFCTNRATIFNGRKKPVF